MLAKLQKYLRSNYLCVVNPQKSKVYDFKKKRQVRWRKFGSPNTNPFGAKVMPLLGFMCPICMLANSSAKHFLVNDKVVCEACALEIISAE